MKSADKPTLFSRSVIDVVVQRMLFMLVGRGKPFSVVQVAEGSGVAARMIECARAEVGSQEWRGLDREELCSVLSALGTRGQNIFLEMMGTQARELDSQKSEPHALIAVLGNAVAAFAQRAPGGFNNTEKGELRPIADELIAFLTPYSSAPGD